MMASIRFKKYGWAFSGLVLHLAVWEASAETLRVRLFERVAQVRLTSDKSFFAQTVSGQLVSRAVLQAMTISRKTGIAINQQDTFERSVVFVPQQGENVSVNGTPYAGTIHVFVEGTALSVVNRVGMEQYLDGVVPSEMPHDWSMEALKAQAVISRTYALYQTHTHKQKTYDIADSVLGQVYKGKLGARPRTHQAILQTQGTIVTYEGNVALTYFHSTSAGHTEDVQEVWGVDRPYLKGVSCPFDKPSPYFTWERTISLSNLEAVLAKSGVGTIATLAPLKYSKAGRIMKMRILHEQGETIVRGEDLRRLLGYHTLPSTNFQITSFGDTLNIRGMGFGHGVGLCQWGAKALAERGFTFDEIILYYYPGVSLQTDSKD